MPVRVSYKGNKEKNIEDIRDFSLVIPTLEYHNVTWTWLDFLLAMKTDSKRVILSQAIKQKLQIKTNRGNKDEDLPQEEDKARMLLGSRVVVIIDNTVVAWFLSRTIAKIKLIVPIVFRTQWYGVMYITISKH